MQIKTKGVNIKAPTDVGAPFIIYWLDQTRTGLEQ